MRSVATLPSLMRSLALGLATLALMASALAQSTASVRANPTRPAAASTDMVVARFNGEPHVELAALAKKLDLKFTVTGKKAVFADASGPRFAFEADDRDFYLDGVRIHLSRPVVAIGSALWVAKLDAEKIVAPLARPADLAAQLPAAPRLIVIDPGHGGTDPGTENKKVRIAEKTAALDVAVRLKKLLETRGWRVRLTREGDTRFSGNPRVDLPLRANFANQAGADLFVSIHFNNAPQAIKGVETYVLPTQHMLSTAATSPDEDTPRALPGNRFDQANLLLGYSLHRAMIRGLGTPDRGFKRARWAVLRTLNCPGVLVECGYLSNDEEARRVAQPAFRQQIADALADGLGAYAEQVQGLRAPVKK